MTESKTLSVQVRSDWRAWLEKHHRTEKVVWLVFFKKATLMASLPYGEAVEEALCFGWIDSIIKKIDEEKYARKFTPRADANKWSELNIQRVRKMIDLGKMTEAGLAKIGGSLLEKEIQPRAKPEAAEWRVPPYILRALEANRTIRENFEKLAPSHKRLYINWIDSAKKEETRERRLQEALDRLSRGEKLGMK